MKTALVTGGAQGIGKCIARALLTRGYRVYIADCDSTAAAETEAEYRSLGDLRAAVCDVGSEADLAAVFGRLQDEAGRLDALVNNAAISAGKPVAELTLEAWNRVLAVNLTSVFLTARYGAPLLRGNRGAIVSIASTRAFMSEPNSEAYAASKGGVVALTHALAASLGPEIRVNAIAPGWIETGEWQQRARRREPNHSDQDRAQHPVGRVGIPNDIASLALYLLSDEAGFITGQTFTVDGGMTTKMIYV